jgi:hypothetical protein
MLDQTRNKVFGRFHQVVHISISLIKLAGSELGVLNRARPTTSTGRLPGGEWR